MKLKRSVLTKELVDRGWLYPRKQNGAWVGYQSKINAGLLEHRATVVHRNGRDKAVSQVMVTPKGLTRLAKALPGAQRHLLLNAA